MRSLTAKTLRGLWAALPTPWNNSSQLEPAVLERNCHRLAEARADGIYTTDSDGEFYAIELDEFRTLAKAFGRAMESLPGIDAAMGVTWSNTAGTINRIRIALDAGIPNVHVAFPIFMPLAKSDVPRFFEDLASAAPAARWIHYAHQRCGPPLSGENYHSLQQQFPDQFIGTKLSTTDATALASILIRSPQLAHFVVDPIMLPGMILGAVGCYSYWINTLPRWHRQFFDACVSKQWDSARDHHLKLIEWETNHIKPLRDNGHLHAIVGKARAALTGYLDDSGVTLAPYYPVSGELYEKMADAFEEFWRDEVAADDLLKRHKRGVARTNPLPSQTHRT